MDETDPSRLKFKESLKELGIDWPICGVQMGDGWAPVVLECLRKMKESGWVGDVTQIKEKFRGLRLYYTNVTRAADMCVEEAENLCYGLCETCGKEREDKGYGMGDADCNACRKAYKDANRR